MNTYHHTKQNEDELHYYREINDIVNDCVLPSLSGGGIEDPMEAFVESYRVQAITEVLRRLPQADYEAFFLTEFDWFVPADWMTAYIRPFFVTHTPDEYRPYARILFLDYRLESTPFTALVGIVAHEIAHLVLDHPLIFVKPDDYEQNEKEAWAWVNERGFDKEARAAIAWLEYVDEEVLDLVTDTPSKNITG